MSDCDTTKDREQPDLSKTTYKRRSSVFQHVTRRLEADSIDNDDNNEECENCSEITTDKEFDIQSYINKLRNERKEWKDTLNGRKIKRRNFQKQKSILQRKKQDIDIDILSEYERSFLLARPRYEHICKNIKILSNTAVKIATLNREIDVLNDRLTLKMENKLRDATKNLIEMSEET